MQIPAGAGGLQSAKCAAKSGVGEERFLGGLRAWYHQAGAAGMQRDRVLVL